MVITVTALFGAARSMRLAVGIYGDILSDRRFTAEAKLDIVSFAEIGLVDVVSELLKLICGLGRCEC